jgi:hypothetical protein
MSDKTNKPPVMIKERRAALVEMIDELDNMRENQSAETLGTADASTKELRKELIKRIDELDNMRENREILGTVGASVEVIPYLHPPSQSSSR